MVDWQPDLYLEFKNERTQPSIDLVSKMGPFSPKSIIDVGCGPGNSTQVLVNRWPEAEIVGIDLSASMIEQAKRDYPHQQWCVADALTFASEKTYDLLFSNAAIQWIPNHRQLLEKFTVLLSSHGMIAVQIPMFWDMPLGKIIDAIANETRWKDKTKGIADLFIIHGYSFYYDALSDLFDDVEIWETHYMHVLENHEAMIQMMRSTGLKPYLQRLSDDEKRAFEGAVLDGIKEGYPVQQNNRVLLPFKRLFFMGKKRAGSGKISA